MFIYCKPNSAKLSVALYTLNCLMVLTDLQKEFFNFMSILCCGMPHTAKACVIIYLLCWP